MSKIRVNRVTDRAGTGTTTLTDQWLPKTVFVLDQIGSRSWVTYNVYSLTDQAAGRWTIGFTNNFDAGDYAVAMGTQSTSDAGSTDDQRVTIRYPTGTYLTASSLEIIISYGGSARIDADYACGTCMGDLA